MQEIVKGMIGKELTNSLLRMLRDFRKLKYDIEEIYRNVKDLNDISIMGLYLLATEKNDNLAFYIKKSYDMVLNNRVNRFKKSIKDNSYINYLNSLNKTEVINMAYYMNLYDLSKKDYSLLNTLDKMYYRILNNYIKNMI